MFTYHIVYIIDYDCPNGEDWHTEVVELDYDLKCKENLEKLRSFLEEKNKTEFQTTIKIINWSQLCK